MLPPAGRRSINYQMDFRTPVFTWHGFLTFTSGSHAMLALYRCSPIHRHRHTNRLLPRCVPVVPVALVCVHVQYSCSHLPATQWSSSVQSSAVSAVVSAVVSRSLQLMVVLMMMLQFVELWRRRDAATCGVKCLRHPAEQSGSFRATDMGGMHHTQMWLI